MANYYKNTNIKLSDTIKLTTLQTISDRYLSNSANFITVNSSYSSDFSTAIDEKITSTNSYYINNTDISTYCIANWIESSTSNFASSLIPSWCNKIRAILIGGGGGGGGRNSVSDTAAVTNQFPYDNQRSFRHLSFQYGSKSDIQKQDQTSHVTTNHNTYSGGGGGGGGFLYLSTTDITNVKSNVNITLGTGGAAGTSGNDTVLTINTTQYKGDKGSAASGTTSGTGGSGNSTYNGGNGGNGGTTTSGTAGLNGGISITNNDSIKVHGKGGVGANSVSNATAGSNGYYRIYYLSG